MKKIVLYNVFLGLYVKKVLQDLPLSLMEFIFSKLLSSSIVSICGYHVDGECTWLGKFDGRLRF